MTSACRVPWTEVAQVLGVSGAQPPSQCQPDWAGRPSLTLDEAAAFVRAYRQAQAAKQRRQDELNASRAARDAAKQNAEAAMWAGMQREAQREHAIRVGAARAVDSLRGLVTAERQEQAFRDGAELAAELFDRDHPK